MLSLTSNYNSIQQDNNYTINKKRYVHSSCNDHPFWLSQTTRRKLTSSKVWVIFPPYISSCCLPRLHFNTPKVQAAVGANTYVWQPQILGDFWVGYKGPFLALQLTWVAKNSGHPTAIQEVRVYRHGRSQVFGSHAENIIEGKFGCSRVVAENRWMVTTVTSLVLKKVCYSTFSAAEFAPFPRKHRNYLQCNW